MENNFNVNDKFNVNDTFPYSIVGLKVSDLTYSIYDIMRSLWFNYRLSEEMCEKYPDNKAASDFFEKYPLLSKIECIEIFNIFKKVFVETENNYVIFIGFRKDLDRNTIFRIEKNEDNFFLTYKCEIESFINVISELDFYNENIKEEYDNNHLILFCFLPNSLRSQ